jgi:hypothetical protein
MDVENSENGNVLGVFVFQKVQLSFVSQVKTPSIGESVKYLSVDSTDGFVYNESTRSGT